MSVILLCVLRLLDLSGAELGRLGFEDMPVHETPMMQVFRAGRMLYRSKM